MRSMIGPLRRGPRARAADPPVPYTSRRALGASSGLLAPPVGAPTETHLTTMGYVPTLSAIVGRTTEALAGVDWHLYRQAPPGTPPEHREQVTSHAALDLWNSPNAHFTRQEFVETTAQHHELTGEQWWVVVKAAGLPLELWPARPDRMRPIPSTEAFVAGYVYRSPDGEEVPLDTSDVVFIRRPNPLDIYRGLGVVQALLVDLDSSRFTAEWNRNFFLNSAEPGGIIQVDKRLSDDEYAEMVMRWREQHQGVAQAHRVAVLEQGQWIDRKFSMRDMQFPELRQMTSEVIREGFGFPKPLLGTVADVNRANADAAEVMFARWLLVPRLERLKQALNHDLLPMFGRTARGLEFDYVSPVPEDAQLDITRLTARTQAYVLLTGGGVTPQSASEVCGLPPLDHTLAPAPSAPAAATPAPAAVPAARRAPRDVARPVAVLPPPPAPEPPDDETPATLPEGASPDPAPVEEAWEKAVAAGVALWLAAAIGSDDDRAVSAHGAAGIAGRVVEQVRAAVVAGDVDALTRITVDVSDVAADLGSLLVDHAEAAARQVVAEAAEQDVVVTAGAVDRQALRATARVTAADLGAGLRGTAVREASRVWGPGVAPDTVAVQVADALVSLTDAQPVYAVGGAVTGAEAAGREATILTGPSAALYADERSDRATCGPCAAVAGRWVGNSDDPARPWRALYPVRGYVGCLGRDRCRGRLVAVWRGGTDWRQWIEKQPVDRGGQV